MEILEFFAYEPKKGHKIPLFQMSVSAGYPTAPAEQEIDRIVDLNEFLIEHPAATFFARVNGHNLRRLGINNGDVLIIDSAIEPEDSKLVVALINGELTLKHFREINGKKYLQGEDRSFVPLSIEPYLDFNIIGIVTKVIHSL
jgi:DNA polymerase V